MGQLRRHASSHLDEGEFKPSFKPFAPTNLVPPPDAPDVLPSFMVVTRQVRPASISPAQHEQLYPKVGGDPFSGVKFPHINVQLFLFVCRFSRR